MPPRCLFQQRNRCCIRNSKCMIHKLAHWSWCRVEGGRFIHELDQWRGVLHGHPVRTHLIRSLLRNHQWQRRYAFNIPSNTTCDCSHGRKCRRYSKWMVRGDPQSTQWTFQPRQKPRSVSKKGVEDVGAILHDGPSQSRRGSRICVCQGEAVAESCPEDRINSTTAFLEGGRELAARKELEAAQGEEASQYVAPTVIESSINAPGQSRERFARTEFLTSIPSWLGLRQE